MVICASDNLRRVWLPNKTIKFILCLHNRINDGYESNIILHIHSYMCMQLLVQIVASALHCEWGLSNEVLTDMNSVLCD